MDPKKTLRTDGDKYIPYEKRIGPYQQYILLEIFQQKVSKIYKKVNENIDGKIAIKVHTGEPNGPNIIPRPWVENLIKKELPKATLVETNAYYKGERYTKEQHRETLKING